MTKARFFMGAAGAATDQRLNMTDLRVLCILGTFTNNKGWCFPKQSTLASLLHRSRPVVNASLRRLEECGYIESKKKKGGANSKLYRVVLDVKEDAHDLPDGLFEVEEDVGPADIHKPKPRAKAVRPTDMSIPQTCLPDKHLSPDMSAQQTPDVGPADTHRELEPSNQTEEPAAAAKAARPKPRHLPDDWDPRDEEVRVAESLNFTRAQFDELVNDFRVYWHGEAANKTKASRKADWDSTFRNRIRAVAGWWKTSSQKRSKLTGETTALTDAEKLYAFESMGRWDASWGPRPIKQEALL